MAEQALEIGLSNNFDLRDHPLNNLVRAKLYLNDQNTEKAIKILNETLANPEAPGKSARPVSKIPYSEFWITIFLELVYCYRKLGKTVSQSIESTYSISAGLIVTIISLLYFSATPRRR